MQNFIRCSFSLDSLLRNDRRLQGKGGSRKLLHGGEQNGSPTAAATCEAKAKHPEKCYKSQIQRNNTTHVLEQQASPSGLSIQLENDSEGVFITQWVNFTLYE